ncbi:MAG: type I methionyl aminopeptidase [Oscillospiraceae bacterium]|jgi:methionyl aminopeptidase|nr:type I methionyl aminopeptidase [Oscillospiraceae bacterium]
MIRVKTASEIIKMREAGKIAAGARALAGRLAVPGAKTSDIDSEVRRFIKARGAEPTFLGYNGFPKSVCISVNDRIIHGIPGSGRLRSGDIVSIDVGATKDGFVGDCAATFAVGDISGEAQTLIDATRQSFFEGLAAARAGNRVSDISKAVQTYAESLGFGVVREYVGHGVGKELHEDPEVPNYVQLPRKGADPRLIEGMTIAIEPMVNAGGSAIRVLTDGWTVVTADGSLSAHYENTVLITRGEPEILTRE